jgi:signal peptidase I
MKRDTAFVALLSGLAFLFLAYVWLFDNVKMESAAMEPRIHAHDYLMVWRAAYAIRVPFAGDIVRTGVPARGDVVLLEKDSGGSESAPIDAVLRVVGLPGEVVAITDKKVIIDGLPLTEKYASFSDARVYPEGLSTRDNMAAIVVPEDGWFVMGDRRDVSTDSRFFGTVKSDEIVGKVVWVYW